jgi:hypothetical protein
LLLVIPRVILLRLPWAPTPLHHHVVVASGGYNARRGGILKSVIKYS